MNGIEIFFIGLIIVLVLVGVIWVTISKFRDIKNIEDAPSHSDDGIEAKNHKDGEAQKN